MNQWRQILNHAGSIGRNFPDRTARMTALVDLLWEELSPNGLSWIGFYLDQPDQAEETRLILGPRRDKPACSPIGLHGACGKVLLTRTPLIVADVRELGAGYIACDPLDQSELVLPCIDSDGSVWGSWMRTVTKLVILILITSIIWPMRFKFLAFLVCDQKDLHSSLAFLA